MKRGFCFAVELAALEALWENSTDYGCKLNRRVRRAFEKCERTNALRLTLELRRSNGKKIGDGLTSCLRGWADDEESSSQSRT